MSVITKQTKFKTHEHPALVRLLEKSKYEPLKGIYKCPMCHKEEIKLVNNANKNTGKCSECYKIKPLKDMPYNFVRDLGMEYPTEQSKKKSRMCIAECLVCQDEYRTSALDLKAGKSSMCRSCSLSLSGWSDQEWENRGKMSTHFKAYTVYVIRMFHQEYDETFIKIGKTYTSVEGRYSRESKTFPYTFEVLETITDSSGVYISKLERALQKAHKEFKYTPSTKFCGVTECFSEYKTDIKNKVKEEIDNDYR